MAQVRKAKTGWSKRAPSSELQRRKLKEKCGAKAFLDPKELAYPIMTVSKGGAQACTFDCAGIQAAYKRARQRHAIAKKRKFAADAHHHNQIAKKAHKKGRELGCNWAKHPFGPKQ